MSSWVSRELVTGLRSAVLLRILVSNTSSKHREYGLQADVTKVCIGDVANENPSNLEDTFPLVRCPDSTASCIVDLIRRRESVLKFEAEANVRVSTFLPSRKSDHCNRMSGRQEGLLVNATVT